MYCVRYCVGLHGCAARRERVHVGGDGPRAARLALRHQAHGGVQLPRGGRRSGRGGALRVP